MRKPGMAHCLHSKELLGPRQEFDSLLHRKELSLMTSLCGPLHTKVKNLGLTFKRVQNQHEYWHVLLVYNLGKNMK